MEKNNYVLALLRIGMGWIFLWAFLDKTFGLGFATAADKAWLAGGSPTFGFLKLGTVGPFAPIYQAIAGHPVVNWLFMLGLLLIGLSLLLGIGVKVAGHSGALMVLLMWTAVLPPKNNPFLDDHIIYGLVLISFALTKSGHTWGLGKWWSQTAIVKKYPFLA